MHKICHTLPCLCIPEHACTYVCGVDSTFDVAASEFPLRDH